MKKKANRLDAIKMIISSKEVGSQEELLQELGQEGFELTQATLSRDLKQLKVAKAPLSADAQSHVSRPACPPTAQKELSAAKAGRWRLCEWRTDGGLVCPAGGGCLCSDGTPL